MDAPRQYALCKFVVPDEEYHWYPFQKFSPRSRYGVYVYLGEIPNMLGHCVVSCYRTGQILSGYHTDNFVELTEDEV